MILVLALACRPDPVGDAPEAPRFEASIPTDPGYRPVARLTRAEYDATIHALLDTKLSPGASFPADESAAGFDNIAEALTTTSIHVELWEAAAIQVLAELFGRVGERTELYGAQGEGPGVVYDGLGVERDDAYGLAEGSLLVPVTLRYDGQFRVTVQAMSPSVAGHRARIEVRVDGAQLGEELLTDEQTEYGYPPIELAAGPHELEIRMVNPGSDRGQWRAAIIDYAHLEGPIDPQTGPSDAWERYVPCDPDGSPDRACAREAIGLFGLAAWRRPLADEDVDWALSLYDTAIDEGRDEDQALELAFQGILMAPEFLYRIETDPEPGQTARALDGYEVATRLAAFLWSANPDESLLAAAGDGSLLAGDNVEEAVRRMLADDRSQALVDNLAGQWFDLRKVEGIAPDPLLYPTIDEYLPQSMREGMARAAEGFFRGDDTLPELFLSETVWVDERLALADGLAPPTAAWTRVRVPGRVGLLGTMGWLATQSHPHRPSAVLRGKWVLERLLCSPPPPPPPDVEGVFQPVPEEGSMREQEEAMRADPFCQTCHDAMDPIGFVFGGFDAVGARRGIDELGYPIDTTAAVDGVSFAGPEDLAVWVTADPRLPRCAVEKTLTYALGRPLRTQDVPEIDRITQRFEDGDLTFEALAVAIATSDIFLWRGAPEQE